MTLFGSDFLSTDTNSAVVTLFLQFLSAGLWGEKMLLTLPVIFTMSSQQGGKEIQVSDAVS